MERERERGRGEARARASQQRWGRVGWYLCGQEKEEEQLIQCFIKISHANKIPMSLCWDGTVQCEPAHLSNRSLPSPSRWRCDEAGRLCPSPRRLHRLPTSRGWHYWTFLLEIARSVHLYRIDGCAARLLRRFCLYSVPSHEGFPSLGINIGRYSLHRKCLSACDPLPLIKCFTAHVVFFYDYQPAKTCILLHLS